MARQPKEYRRRINFLKKKAMSNIIKIKGKTTTGAPSLGQLEVREMCFVIPDNAFYIKKDAGTIVGPFTVGGAVVVGFNF